MKKDTIYVVNLALLRSDGKVEQDTLFTEIKPTGQQANEIAEKYDCEVILSLIGTFLPYGYKWQERNTFYGRKSEYAKKEIEKYEI